MLKDTTAPTALDAIKVFADQNYLGPKGAAISIKIETGALTSLSFSSKKVTVTLPSGQKLVKDRVIQRLFRLQYAGAATAATATVTSTKLTVTVDAQSTDLLFTTYPTVGALVNKLNTITGLTAAVLGENKRTAATTLDAVSAQDIKTATHHFRADVMAMAKAINQLQGVTAEKQPGAFKDLANIGNTALVYTDVLDATNTDWQTGIDLLQRFDVDWVVPLSGSDTVHEMVKEHCVFMSDTVNMERRAVVGKSDNTDGTLDLNAINYADTLRSNRVSLVHLGIYDRNDSGKNTFYPPYVTAALVGGMMCGVRPGEPLTNKRIHCTGMQRWLLNPTETDPLIDGGVLVPWRTYDNEFRILQSITTAVSYDEDGTYNFNQNEMSVGAATDYLSKEIRKVADELRGQKNTPYLPLELKARVEARLKQLATPEPEGEGILIGDDDNPAFQGVTVTQGTDWMTVEFQASPVVPANYIGIVIHTAPYQGAGTV